MTISKKVMAYLCILRPWFWLPALCPAIAGACIANKGLPSLEMLLILGFIFGPGIPGAAEALNDFFDRDYDSIKDIKFGFGIPSSGGTGIIQRGWLSGKETVLLSALLFSLTIVIASTKSMVTFILLCIGVILAISYSAPPIRWKNRGIWSCVVQGFAYGFLTFNIGWYANSTTFSIYPILIGLLLGILIVGYGSTADLSDLIADKANNIKTLPVVRGREWALKFYICSMILPYPIIFLLSLLGIISLNRPIFYTLLFFTVFISHRIVVKRSPKSFSQIHMIGVALESIAPFMFI